MVLFWSHGMYWKWDKLIQLLTEITKCDKTKFVYCFKLNCYWNFKESDAESWAINKFHSARERYLWLTHWGRVTHICVGKLTIIGSDNGLSPGRRQAIIWTNTGILLIRPLGTNFSEISIGIQTLSFKKMLLKMSSVKWRPFVSASMC